MAEVSKQQRKMNRIPSLAESVSIIYEYERVRSEQKLAKAYGCSAMKIQYILKMKEEYLREWKNNNDFREVRNEESTSVGTEILGAVVNEWVLRSRSYGLPASDDQLFQIGIGVSKLINIKEFRPTCLWLQRLKKKYNLDNLGPLPVPQPMNCRKSLNLVDILVDFKKQEPSKDLSPNFLNQIDINTQTGEIKRRKRRRNGQLVDYEPVLTTVFSVGYETSVTKNNESIPTIEIDDDDDDVKPLSNLFTNGDVSSKNKAVATSVNTRNFSPKISGEEEKDTPTVRTDQLFTKIAQEEEPVKILSSYKEALDYLRPLEQFVLIKENFRAIGIINELESLYTGKVSSTLK